MRLSVSVLGVLGVVLVLASVQLPWLELEFFDQTHEELLTDYDVYIGSTEPLEQFAYSTALYLMFVGFAVSVYSLLGGFITLAGACTFALGGLLGDTPLRAWGESEWGAVSPGIGLYLAFAAALVTVVAIRYPVDLNIGVGASRPKTRTWHLSRK